MEEAMDKIKICLILGMILFASTASGTGVARF
jgi:hypothetical protein